jgi:hypothetical protein
MGLAGPSTRSRIVYTAVFWLTIASALALAACTTDEPPPTPTATPDTPALASGEPSNMVRQYVDDRLAELGQGSSISGEGRASRVRCADLSEKYLGNGLWEVTTSFNGGGVPRIWHIDESSGEVEDLVSSERAPC